MKRLLLTLVLALALPLTLLADKPDYVEYGTLISKGRKIIVLYEVEAGNYRMATMFWPDGREIRVAAEPGISAQTLDGGLQRIADAQ